MPLKPKEMEKIILADGWILKNQEGSHRHYIHPVNPEKLQYLFIKVKNLIRLQKNPSESRRG